MSTEEYFITEKPYIIALNELNKLIEEHLKDNYYEIIKGKITSEFLEDVLALNTAIKAIIYCMRIKRKEYYQKIDSDYQDNFSLL